MRHELKQLLRAAEARGWVLAVTRRGTRLRLTHADGGVVVAGMPGDRPGLARLQAALRRVERGAPVEPAAPRACNAGSGA